MKLIIILLSAFLFTEGYAQSCNEPNSLVSIRKRKAGATEYVIFTLKKDVTATSAVADATPPFTQDGSGATVYVTGCKYKSVTFKNIVWQCKTKYLGGATNLVRQVKNIGQFEGTIQYIIGYKCAAGHIADYDYDDGNYKKIVLRFKP